MANNDKLRYAAKMEQENGIDPDETMLLSDTEFDKMMSIDREEEALVDELQVLYHEEADLLDKIHELETELIPEAEELVESDAIGEAISEYRSDLSAYRSLLNVNKKRLLEVHKRIEEITGVLKKASFEPKKEEEEYEQLTIEGFDTFEDEVGNELAGLEVRKKEIEARIDYIKNDELPATYEQRDNARDYMSKIELSQDITALNYELTSLTNELNFVEGRITELSGLKR